MHFEVEDVDARYRTLKGEARIFSSLRCRGYPCPRKWETHGGFHITIK